MKGNHSSSNGLYLFICLFFRLKYRIMINMKTVLAAIWLIVPALILAQQPATTHKKALRFFNEAQAYYQQHETDKALMKLSEAICEDPNFVDVYLMQADIYREMDSLNLQVASLEQAMTLNASRFPQTGYVLAGAYFQVGDYEKACRAYQAWIERHPHHSLALRAKERLDKCRTALDLKNDPKPFCVENLGNAINSEYDEYWPSLTVDGQTFIFTRLLPVGNQTNEMMPRYQEDFFESRLINGQWQRAEPIIELNTMSNEGAQSVSADGKLIFFTACNQPDSYGSCDIYFTRLVNGGWTRPQNAGEPVNSGAWESQPSITASGSYLYFASSRKGGKGGMDIWRCQLKSFSVSGRPIWGIAENLGDSVNTTGNEMSPFIHADNHTLYFASDGWDGLGGTDIFYTRLVEDSVWIKPVNLGYPINSVKNEQGMIVDAFGRNAYYSSNRSGSQGIDLYRFELYDDVRPVPVSYVRGYVVDQQSQMPVKAEIKLIDLKNGRQAAQTWSDSKTGEFFMALPLGHEYAFNVSCPGYLFFSENFSLNEVHQAHDPAILNISLQPVEVGNSVVLRNVFFQTDSYDLLGQSRIELDRLVLFLEQNPDVAVEIGGHTDNIGSAGYNDELSEKRALSVWQYLINAGITKNRLSYRGYGMSQPIADNQTEEGRSKNRRTEFKIIRIR